MDISNIFSDDQAAVLGCFVAIALSGMIAALSYRIGPAGKNQTSQQVAIPLNKARSVDTKSQDRRAA